jgi:putative oxidoreductase
MESFGLPGFLLIPAIILEIAGPILIIIGYQTRITAGALSLFCLATAIIFHTDFSNQMQFVAFMKNIALAGGFLFLVVNGAKGYCLDKK